MQSRWYIIIMIGSVLGIFLPLVIWLNSQQELDSELVDVANLYLLAGFIVEGIILFFISNLIQTKRDLRTDRKEHTNDINKIFIRMTHAVIRDRRNGLKIVCPTKDIDPKKLALTGLFLEEKINDYVEIEHLDLYADYYFFDFAIEHLKKYKDTYKYWKNTEKLLEEFNKRKLFKNIIDELIESKMSKSFPDFEKHHGENENFYDPFVIADVVIALWQKQQEELHTLGIRTKYGKPCIITEFGTRPQIGSTDESKLDLEKYKELLKSIVTDKSLKQDYVQEIELDTEIRDELYKFTQKLEPLVKQLKANKLLEGNCDGCP